MNGDIEELVLSGKLFNPPSRTSSPVRSRSPSPVPAQWPNDDSDFDYDSDAERRRAFEEKLSRQQHEQDSIGMGPGRTGVKGVIRDRDEAAETARAKRAQQIHEMNKAMEKASLGGMTWAEEEREKQLLAQALEGGSSRRVPLSKGRFGHLREVGERGYVEAVESEERNVWVVVHIYDPSLDRCASLDETLSKLARLYPQVKFLRARAGALGFASTSSTSKGSLAPSRPPFSLHRTPSRKILVPGRFPTDSDEDDDDEDDSDKESEEGWGDDKVDTDVLPTMLVYRAGELVHSWVRVDWEATMGIEEHLRKHHILADGGSSNGNLGLPSDDEDLIFTGSDDDDF
ncbi:hypothetical protein BDW22DRAFT_1370224 [Trametopsis cervina]|nr:hypothetical protein BDW22DRAFT_1370224 [Trametopsis cervina]